MRRLVMAATCAATLSFVAPGVAFAGDPSETSDHSGKNVDGKINGMTETSAEKIARQQKEAPAMQTDHSDAAPAKAGTAGATSTKSP